MTDTERGSGPTRPPYFYRQSAAIPLRRRPAGPPRAGAESGAEAGGSDGSLEVLMITARSGRRWVVPKGIVEPGLTPAESAANEAWEEAGVRGTIRPERVGVYQYSKWGGTCTVEVFVLDVEEVEETWPEQDLRQRRWLSVDEAADLVREPDLAAMVRGSGR